ncbi:methyltransferase family protein [Kitasatospora atroaurantiaca]|uniref:Methyltransferase family protein n=1 Tax=Kitasatospora atroaurantiaca TaxID=285545 RepID=A0A561EYP7_9ACTN|nr:methyltransferase domain-containing protein [Kitasatospora atroaurantiaca]TWE20728.1 methyltransferase family protein [Kitasatospora atroaurantiaca]
MPVHSGEYLRLGPLQTRIKTHRRYSEHVDDVEAAVMAQLWLQPRESLLDVGCGTGSFLARLRDSGHSGPLSGLDSSPAASLACAEIRGVRAVVGDAVQLPFPNAEFDAVTARHMLYHVSDVPAALRETSRVLRAGGRFVAVVNHADVTPRIASVVREQAARHGATPSVSPNAEVNSASLPAQMAEVFGPVDVVAHDNSLVFDTPEPVVAFGQALMNFYGVGDDSPEQEAVAAGIEQAVRAWFARNSGPWRDPKGYVVCTARRRD